MESDRAMTTLTDRRLVLASRPDGEPGPANFQLVEEPAVPLAPGQVRLRTIYSSVDPAMRIRMREGKSYIPPFRIGDTLGTYSVGEVIESRAEGLAPGDFAWTYSGWQLYPVLDARAVFRIDPAGVPLSAYIGVLGFTGFTAWVGLEDIGRPKPGETVLVTAASGAVGSIAGQLAKRAGAHVVGVTSGATRCAELIRDYGFDATIDRTDPDFATALTAAFPGGIDVFFDNSGGPIQRLALPMMNLRGRVVLCGMIAQYNDAAPEPGPNLMTVVTNRLRVEGFIASDSVDRLPAYQRQAGAWVQDGTLRAEETIAQGLEAAPAAFAALLRGDKRGKLAIQLGNDPFAPERDF